MSSAGMDSISVVMAALFLRGSPFGRHAPNSKWLSVWHELGKHNASMGEASGVLNRAGLWYESARLQVPGLLAWAESLHESGKVLTVADPDYPGRWLSRLHTSAPAALWCHGRPLPTCQLGVVGSRSPHPESCAFVASAVARACESGLSIVSGGARGIDRFASNQALAAGSLPVEILPHGISLSSELLEGACTLSVCAPQEPFTVAAAMERNSLIYSAGSKCLVVQPRFKQGGTWQGATSALRRKLCEVCVSQDPSNQAVAALVNLGATLMDSAYEIAGTRR